MDVTLSAQIGRTTGSGSSKRLRAEGRVPAVVYGLDTAPLSVSVQWTELRKALNTEAGLNALITLEVDGGSELTIVKDLDFFGRFWIRRAEAAPLAEDRALDLCADLEIFAKSDPVASSTSSA